MTSLKLLRKWLQMQQIRYDKALGEAMKSRRTLQAHQQQLEYLQSIQSEYDCPEGTTIKSAALAGRKDFQQFLQQMTDKQSAQVEKDRLSWSEHTRAVTTEKQKLDSIEKLLSRQLQKEQSRLERQDQKHLDDLLAHQHTEEME